jgi:hypothetical protein
MTTEAPTDAPDSAPEAPSTETVRICGFSLPFSVIITLYSHKICRPRLQHS